jgi:hypothetical protein
MENKILLAHGLLLCHSRESGNPESPLPHDNGPFCITSPLTGEGRVRMKTHERTKLALSFVEGVRGNNLSLS